MNPVQAKNKENENCHLYHLMQEKSSSHKAFCDSYNNCLDVIEHCGGTLVDCNEMENELSALSLTVQSAT